jgi:hypothetical protein
MAHLVYYEKENQEFNYGFSKKFRSKKEAELIYNKLVRHFKLRRVSLEWTSGRNHPCCNGWRVMLNIDRNDFGVLCHEVAHLFQFQNPKYRGNGGRFHNKKHRKIMNRMIHYCQKKNWFETELERKTEPKPEPLMPSPEALRQEKIQRLEESTKRCSSKIKRYQNLIKKNNRRISHLRI